MNTKKVDDYKEIAKANLWKLVHCDKIAEGDFLYLTTGCGKEDGLRNFVMWDGRENGAQLVKVVGVVDVPESFDLTADWMAQPAPEHRGGSQSDDVPDDHNPYNYTPEEISTFYQLVTVYRNGKGQFIAVDCQGYNYWRYVYLSPYWRQMFAAEVEDLTLQIAEEWLAGIEAEMKLQQKQAEQYAAKIAALRVYYHTLKENPKGAAGVTANVKKWFAVEFPGLAVKVSTRPNYWGNGYEISVRMSRNIPEDDRNRIYNRVEMWYESTPNGERSEGDTVYACPMSIFGNVAYRGINVTFYD